MTKEMHYDKPQQINDPAAKYIGRINRAIDYVVANLGQSLNLDEVSRQAGFSPFHFHRVFKELVGETLNQFIKRKRLERALYQMSHAPQRSLTDVALDCGFASSSDFSRSFKQLFGMAPRAFDLTNFRNVRREAFERICRIKRDLRISLRYR